MNEEEREIVKKFERLYLKDFNNEKITNEDRLSYIECALITNLIEKLQKENEELKQERELVGVPVRNKRDGKIGIILHQWKSGSIAVLENIKPRVINTHDDWNTLEIINDNVEQKRTKNDCISIQKVKDKIEEILNNKEYRIVFEGNAEFPDDATIINAQKYIKLEKMQELIEESEEN
jgi:hypothetical protein